MANLCGCFREIAALRTGRTIAELQAGRSPSQQPSAAIPIERGTTAANNPAGSFPEGFRTTAPVRAAQSCGLSSETLYKTHRQHIVPATDGLPQKAVVDLTPIFQTAPLCARGRCNVSSRRCRCSPDSVRRRR
jgi:hypothetical protein